MKHRFFVPTERIRDADVRFSDEQAHQIRTVLRLRDGDAVRIFDGATSFDRVVVLAGPAGTIVGAHPQVAEPRTHLVAYPALLQRHKFETVLQKLTEIGAAGIRPVLSARGQVREPPDDHRQTRWRAILREAAEQSGRGRVPDLLPALPFGLAVQQACAAGTAILAYEAEQQATLRDALQGAPKVVGLFVGPEGGYEPGEADCARQAGARVVTLGPRILRAETASPVLAALVLYEVGDLSSPGDDN